MTVSDLPAQPSARIGMVDQPEARQEQVLHEFLMAVAKSHPSAMETHARFPTARSDFGFASAAARSSDHRPGDEGGHPARIKAKGSTFF